MTTKPNRRRRRMNGVAMILAFLNPAIVQQLLAGDAPAALTFDSLSGPDSIPALWSAQRALHQISLAR